MWPPALSDRFITPPLRAAFDSIPRRCDVDTVVSFIADILGAGENADFDGRGEEWERLACRLPRDADDDTDEEEGVNPYEGWKEPPGDVVVDPRFRIRALLLLHLGERGKAKDLVLQHAWERAGMREGKEKIEKNRKRDKQKGKAKRKQEKPKAASTISTPRRKVKVKAEADPVTLPQPQPSQLQSQLQPTQLQHPQPQHPQPRHPSQPQVSSLFADLAAKYASPTPALLSYPSSIAASPLSTCPPPPSVQSSLLATSSKAKERKRKRALPKPPVDAKSLKPQGREPPAPKNVRPVSCSSCRKLKTACDNARPHCARCVAKGRTCVYQTPDCAALAPTTTATARRRKKQKARMKHKAMVHDQAAYVDQTTPALPKDDIDDERCHEGEAEDDGEDDSDCVRKGAKRRKSEAGMAKVVSVPRAGSISKSARKPAVLGTTIEPKHRSRWTVGKIDNALLCKLGLPLLPAEPVAPRSNAARGVRPRSKNMKQVVAAVENGLGTRLPPDGIGGKTPQRGIRSSTFASVMRLVLGLPRPQRRAPAVRLPAPSRRPPVWAQSRQELCEALPYYRAFQSGMYMYKRVPFGYLLDGFPSPRDLWAADGRVIISHGGGQAVRILNSKGQVSVSLAADHTPSDARIDTLILAAEKRTPVVLLAGEGYELLPWNLGCAYAVLGWYWVSATWYEAEPCAANITPARDRDWFRRLKVRFDWIDTQGTPWWLLGAEGTPSWVAPEPAKKMPIANSMEALNTQMKMSQKDSCIQGHHVTPPPPTSPIQEHVAAAVSATSTAPWSHRAERVSSPEVTGVTMPLRPISIIKEVGELAVSSDPNTAITSNIPVEGALPTPPPDAPFCSELLPVRQDAHIPRPEVEGDIVWDRPAAPRHSTPPQVDDIYFSPLDYHRGSRIPGDHLLANFHPPPPRIRPWYHAGESCPSCGELSPRLYREGWTCLVPDCAQFWMLNTTLGLVPISPSMSLCYHKAFIKVAPTPFEASSLPFNIVPPVPTSSALAAGSMVEEAGSRTLWRGWVCDRCSRANCRYRWEMFECRACGRQVAVQSDNDVVSARAIKQTREDPLGEADEGSLDIPMSVRRISDPAATVVAYTFPHAGTVYHVLHDSTHEVDPLWEEYQRAAIDTTEPLFERRALKSNVVKGQLLSQQYTLNSGIPYKYIVDTLSWSLEQSPSCVKHALRVIRSCATAVLRDDVAFPASTLNFNECLSVLYREGQKMDFHNDAEPGLGPVVAALSLGSPATMSFRPKAKGGRGSGLNIKSQSKPKTVLNLTLSHGDVVIMAGREIQFMYDHRVIPSGLRVAATARLIKTGE